MSVQTSTSARNNNRQIYNMAGPKALWSPTSTHAISSPKNAANLSYMSRFSCVHTNTATKSLTAYTKCPVCVVAILKWNRHYVCGLVCMIFPLPPPRAPPRDSEWMFITRANEPTVRGHAMPARGRSFYCLWYAFSPCELTLCKQILNGILMASFYCLRFICICAFYCYSVVVVVISGYV